MSDTKDHSIETLRLQSPEELGRQRVYEFSEALVLIERSLNSMGLSLTDELPSDSVVPKSTEVNQYQRQQEESAVVTKAEKITKQAAELFVDRARENTLNSFTGLEQNPLFDLEDTNA